MTAVSVCEIIYKSIKFRLQKRSFFNTRTHFDSLKNLSMAFAFVLEELKNLPLNNNSNKK